MSAILNTQAERRWVTETLSDRSGVVHDRVIGYLHIIDTLGGVIDSLQKERIDALGALTMIDTGTGITLADKINELRSLWVSEARKRQMLQASVEAMLAWPYSEDPSMGCEQATAQAQAALASVEESPGPSYTEDEVRQAVKYVSGRDSVFAVDDTIDYLRSNRTAT